MTDETGNIGGFDKIHLRGMAFFGYHGPRSIEREIGQHYQVDITLHVSTIGAAETDSIGSTIDYADIYEVARKVVTKSSFKLIETIAERIASTILGTFDVFEVDVSVRKLKPAIRGIMDYVEVSINRKKQ